MIKINGIPILESEMSVLLTLKNELAVRGINRFDIFKESGNNIMTNCPFHSGGHERKPSFGISKDGKCNCFACGYHGDISDMISKLFGYNDDGGKYGQQWLTSNFITLSVENRKKIQLNLDRNQSNNILESDLSYVSEEELNSYRYIHPYMYKRKLNDDIIEEFDVGYDKNTDCITFPVWDENGNCVFIARRSVKTKYFNYPKDVDKPVYLANYIIEKNIIDTVVICESILNALTCWKYNIPAVALLGTGDYKQYEILKKLPNRKYITALDADTAGYKGTKKIRNYLSKYKIITQWDIPSGYDLNDLDSEILNLHEIL